MEVKHRGYKISAKRDKALGGWTDIYWSAFRDDGRELTSGFGSYGTVREAVKHLKLWIDAVLDFYKGDIERSDEAHDCVAHVDGEWKLVLPPKIVIFDRSGQEIKVGDRVYVSNTETETIGFGWVRAISPDPMAAMMGHPQLHCRVDNGHKDKDIDQDNGYRWSAWCESGDIEVDLAARAGEIKATVE